MEGFDPLRAFGTGVAKRYDDQPRGDEDDAVAFLVRVAGAGPALEFAVGTGRIAVPLAVGGIAVDGIEVSEAMIERLRAKPGGDAIGVTVGDMSTTQLDGRYPLMYLVFNTIFNLLTQDDQVRCFENAAHHLTPDGAFVVEAGIPDAWVRRDNYVDAEHVGVDRVVFDVCRYDPVTQLLDENHVELTPEGIRFGPIVCRLAPPSELDLMARLAGLRLVERWGGWCGEPFDARSVRHVSVYRAA